mgnify:FL=1
MVPPDGAQINNPAPGNWLWGKIEKPAPNRTIVRVIVDTTGIEYVNHVINDAWFGWRQYATATQPQEYDLPLADGWVGSIRYSKTQEGLVSLIVSIGKAAAIGVGTFQVGTLPSGYYPRNEVSCAAVNSMGSTLHTASRLVVNPSGGILLQQTDETASGIFASITFAS